MDTVYICREICGTDYVVHVGNSMFFHWYAALIRLLSLLILVVQALSLAVILQLAYQSIGVVYGDVGTSPLYVFGSTFSSGHIDNSDDVLGVLSIIIYTLTLIPVVKYVFIVLRANDNGEGEPTQCSNYARQSVENH